MKAVLIHGILAVLGLGLAYQTWTRDPEKEEAPGAVTIAECREGDLQKLQVETESNRISVEPQKTKDETLYWITVQRKPKKPPEPKTLPDGGVEKAPEPPKEDAEQLKPKVFIANAAFKDYLKLVTPLKATQGLGTLPQDKLADFGFDKVDTTWQMQCGGKTLDFEAGSRTFGSSSRYVRDAKSKAAYLWNDDLVSDLQSAQFKFMQTDLHAFAAGDVEEVTVEARGAKKRLLQRDRKLGDKALYVDASAPAKRNELYNNWLSRVGRLRAREYLAKNAEPGSDLKTSTGETTPVVTIEYKVADGKAPGKLELVKVDENGTPHYYARSEATRGWVTVFDSAAKEVEQDAAMVVGLEETPPEKSEPKKPGAADPHGGGMPSGHPVVPGTPSAAPAMPGPGMPGNPHAMPGNPHAMPPGNPHAMPTPQAAPAKTQ